MAAVMLDHEQTHEKSGRRYREQQADPVVAEIKAEPRRRPQQRERSKRDENLNQAAASVRATVARKNSRPTRRVVWCRSRSRAIVHRHIRFNPSAAVDASLAHRMLIWNRFIRYFIDHRSNERLEKAAGNCHVPRVGPCFGLLAWPPVRTKTTVLARFIKPITLTTQIRRAVSN